MLLTDVEERADVHRCYRVQAHNASFHSCVSWLSTVVSIGRPTRRG